VGAVENTFESNRGLEEEGMCGKVVVVRIDSKVEDEITAGLILELGRELVLCG